MFRFRPYKPQGYEGFLRAYLIDCDGNTIEITRNNNVPADIFGYLIQCDGTLIGDCDGDLTHVCFDCNEPAKVICGKLICKKCCGRIENGIPQAMRELLMNLEKYKNSWIRTKDDVNYFEFSADLEGMWVNIEYFANQTVGVEECAIRVLENIKRTLEYFIKYRLLEGGQDTIQQSQFFLSKI